jgi:hypothetical protein
MLFGETEQEKYRGTREEDYRTSRYCDYGSTKGKIFVKTRRYLQNVPELKDFWT